MNFPVSALLGFLLVFQTMNRLNQLNPLPERIKTTVTAYQDQRYQNIDRQILQDALEFQNPHRFTVVPAKPLVTFEKYLAMQKKKSIKRRIASVGKPRKVSQKLRKQQKPAARVANR
ncbi:hypothetical protein [Bdellovibrio sp. HCB288]|uniref:hypothetical protein n=1 Tax=Bdellovibrio sp. HCB288 TaxID=3394355 RepID=UPI0039B6059B